MATTSEPPVPSSGHPDDDGRRRRRRRRIVYGSAGGGVAAAAMATGVYFFFFAAVVYHTLDEAVTALRERHPRVEAPKDPESGLATTLRALEPSAETGTGAEAALAFLKKPEVAAALGLSPEARFEHVDTVVDSQRRGDEVLRFRQMVDNVRVFGADVAVSMRRDGQSASINTVTTRPAPPAAVDLTPAIDAPAARVAAMAHYARRAADPQARLPADAAVRNEELVVFDPGRFGLSGDAALAWRVAVDSLNIFVDAKDARIIVAYDERPTALARLTHDCRQTTDCRLVLADDPPLAPSGPQAALEARRVHAAAASAHAYFKAKFNRDGFDDAEGTGGTQPTRSFVQVARFDNARWMRNGSRFEFGLGWATLDIAGHEYTHAVTTYGSDVINLGESGAVGEFFSDFFAVMIERSVTGRIDWRIGDGLPGRSSARPLRNMEEPHNGTAFNRDATYDAATNYGQPHHYGELVKDTHKICSELDAKDNGCVHFNSGILSRAIVLAVDGGHFGPTKVTPIGADKAERIIYQTMTVGVTQAAKILDAANGAVTSCKSLVNSYGITPTDCANLATAFAAVLIPVTP
jgi:Zn-dependent metalloprotease